jgi:uncharacterized protein YegJ (DUF2314 family)
MLYVERNAMGNIIAVKRNADTPGMELKQTVDDEILQFLFDNEEMAEATLRALTTTDARIVRILEDLVDLLVKKNIIMFTELPEAAQSHLRERQQIRKMISQESFIVDDIT